MSLSSIGLSGMRAAQQQLDTTAHNVANTQTPHFRRHSVVQTAQPGLGGVNTRAAQSPTSTANGNPDLGNLAEDLVTQKMAVYNFAANLRSVEAEDRMLGALLDAKA